MTVFELMAALILDTSEYDDGLDDAERKAEGFGEKFSGLSTVIKTGMATAAAAIAGVTTAIGGLTKSAVDAYSEYEQLAGGIETLFGDAADTVLENARNAFQTAGMSANEYMDTVMSFSAQLLQSTAKAGTEAVQQDTEAMKKELDNQYNVAKESYDAQYKERKRYLDKEYDELRTSLSKQYNALKDGLDRQYDERRKTLDKQLDRLSDSLDAELQAIEKNLTQKERALEREQEAEIEAYEKATDAKIRLIDKEYMESIKNIDRQKYEQLKAIDEKIKALNKEADAEKKSVEMAERLTKQAEYDKAMRYAKTAEDRKLAESKLSEFLEKNRQEDNEAARKDEIESLKEQKDAIRDRADEEKAALKEQRDSRIDAIKEESKEWLKATREANREEREALKENNRAILEDARRAKKEKLEAAREANQEELSELKRSQNEQLSNLRESQDSQLEAMKNSHEDQLDELKRSNNASLSELKDYIKNQKEILKSGDGDLSEKVEQTAESRKLAADIANMALQDMSDNVNKMGTNMDMVMNAYRGFARGSYVMLDNLALGYGGTQAEMERLLEEAEAISGVHYDIGNLSDIIKAIHEIQKEMGITGTTADEAQGTISGSLSMVKAAWQNLLIALGDGNNDISDEIDDLVDSAEAAFDNLWPTIIDAMEGIGELVTAIAPKIIEKLPELLDTIVPPLLEIFGLIKDAIFPSLSETALNAGKNFINFLINGIREASNADFIGTALETVRKFSETIREKAGELVDKGIELALNLARGIADAMPAIIENVPVIISNIAGVINDNLPKILEAGIKIILTLIKGLLDAIPTLVKNIPTIIKAIFDVFMAVNWLGLGKSVITFIGHGFKEMFMHLPTILKDIGNKAVEWLKLIEWKTLGLDIIDLIRIGIEFLFNSIPNALKSIGHTAVEWFSKIDWIALGKNIVLGIIEGIGNATGWLVDKIVSLGEDALNAALNFFGINSPSRLFRDRVGVAIPEGIALGVDRNRGFVENSVVGLGEFALEKATDAFSGLSDVVPDIELDEDIISDFTPGDFGSDLSDEVYVEKIDDDERKRPEYPPDYVTINVYPREDQDERSIAEEVLKYMTMWNDQKERVYA